MILKSGPRIFTQLNYFMNPFLDTEALMKIVTILMIVSYYTLSFIFFLDDTSLY